MKKMFKKWGFGLLSAFLLCSCSGDKTAGTDEQSEGITAIKNLDIAGVSQKGPFAKGSAVTVQGIDCKTLEFTDEKFEGKVKSDKGDFAVDDVTLSSTCAVFEVTGNYFNEVTGKKTKDKLTLHALTDLKDRKNVNINLLTELEYERVMNLATGKDMTFADAKKQAEEEVLAAFGVNDGAADKVQEFENLNIFEKGDENAALLAVSVLMQGDEDVASLAKRLEKFSDDFAEDGEWNDGKTRNEITEWAATAKENGKLDTIRKNVETMNDGDKVDAFEKLVENSGVTLSETSVKSNGSSSSKKNSSSSNVILSSDSREGSSDDSKDSYLNPNIDYGEFMDKRDGQTYKYVEIDGVTWMAQSMNYATPNASSALCPSATEKSCPVHGLIYTWEEAVNVCPEGWHLPSYSEWNSLGGYMWTNHNGDVSGPLLSSKLGQKYTDEYGFSVTDANYYPLWSDSTKKYEGCYWDPYDNSFFWTDSLDNNGAWYFSVGMADSWSESVSKACLNQVRCVMDSIVSSSSVASSSSVESSSSAEPPKTALDFLNPSIEYGEFVDDRDNQKYKSVKIGNQIWMAQNLNYAYEQKTRSGSASSFCYKNEPDSCGKYGRLYLWSAALDSAAQFSKDGEGCGNEVVCEFEGKVRGVCPSGWHLPDTTEFRGLLNFVGDSSATKLKANEAWGVSYENPYGFSALPAGGYDYRDEDRSINPHFDYAGGLTYFWSIVSRDHDDGYALAMDYSSRYAKLAWSYKYNARSVRCIKN